jgi:D-galactose 1-dehydrogenase
LTKPLHLGLVGFGKIARDQHVPAIASTSSVELIAIASRNAVLEGVRNYTTLEAMLGGEPTLDAVILCQPPGARFEAASMAIKARKHVFLEKPPGATVASVEALIALADQYDATLFASWHSRFGAAVAIAKTWVAAHRITSVAIEWQEDIRIWHPGQDWILEQDGFGVFDPGINALAILTRIIGEPVRLVDAQLHIPANRGAAVKADLIMESAHGLAINADFDFLHAGQPAWNITIAADGQTLRLSAGGNILTINNIAQLTPPEEEYPAMYRHFVALIAAGESDVDIAPLALVEAALSKGQRVTTDPFHF